MEITLGYLYVRDQAVAFRRTKLPDSPSPTSVTAGIMTSLQRTHYGEDRKEATKPWRAGSGPLESTVCTRTALCSQTTLRSRLCRCSSRVWPKMKPVDNIPCAINTGGPEGYTRCPPATEVERNDSLNPALPPSQGGNFVSIAAG